MARRMYHRSVLQIEYTLKLREQDPMPNKEGAMSRAAAFTIALVTALAAVPTPSHPEDASAPLEGTVTISGAWALYPMVVRWGEEFQRLHHGVKLDISAGGAGKGMADALGGMADIGMVSRGIYPEEEARGAFWVAVTRDAVFPTVNTSNPVLSQLQAKGVTREGLRAVWIEGTTTGWGALVSEPEVADPINLYTRSDACGAAQTWAQYFGQDQEDLQGIGVYGDPGVAMSVARDPRGFGFNNLNYAYDPDSGAPVPGIAVLPIDVNENGVVDPEEGPYATKTDAVRAVARSRYPAPPARDLNLVTKGVPSGLTRAFMEWVLTEGQQYVPDAGYIAIGSDQLQEQLSKLRLDQ
jgi:phosphate transport system substrate-binding protein